MSGPDLHEGQLYCHVDDCEGLLLLGMTFSGWRSVYADGEIITRPDGIKIVVLDPNSSGNDDVDTDENDIKLSDTLFCSQCGVNFQYQLQGAT